MKSKHKTHEPNETHGHMALRANTKPHEHRLAADTKTPRTFRVPKGFRNLSWSAEDLGLPFCVLSATFSVFNGKTMHRPRPPESRRDFSVVQNRRVLPTTQTSSS